MANDDDVIYVDVAARLDEAAADKATGKLRDKFKDAGKGIGKVLGSDIGREILSEVAEPVSKELEKVAKGWGHSVTKSIGDAIGGQFGDIAKNLGDSLIEGGVETVSDSLKAKLKGVKDTVDDVKKSFADLKDGKPEEVLKRIDENADKLPEPLKKVHDELKPIGDAFDEIKGTGKDVIDIFAGLEIISPRLASGLLQVAAPLGEIAGSLAMVPKIDDWLKNLPGGIGKGFGDLLPDTNDWNWFKQPFREMGGDLMHPSRLGQGGLYDKNGNYIGPGSGPSKQQWWTGSDRPKSPSAGGNFLPGLPGSIAGGGTPGSTPSFAPPDTGGMPPANTHPSGFSVPLAQNPDGTWTSPNSSWAHLIQRESGGRNIGQQITDSNGGPGSPNAAQGLFQITPQTWRGHGGTAFAPTPLSATPQQQAEIAARILQSNPSGSDWGAGMSGRESAGGLLAGLAGNSGGPVQATLSDFNMPAPSGGGGFHASPAGLGSGPPGLPSLGGPATPPTQGNSYQPQQQQSLGSGKGAGITGGGLIGLGEQAGAMAAGAMTFGGGAIAAQLAEQEINLASQKGSQMAATLAMAPLETFGLAGGQMGAPSVSNGGWYKKIVGGLMGQQNQIPNMAGATQPPKDPKQDDPNKQGGQGQQGQQGQGGGPKGSQDDPMHVKVTNQNPGPPQGSATSAMNSTGVQSGMTV